MNNYQVQLVNGEWIQIQAHGMYTDEGGSLRFEREHPGADHLAAELFRIFAAGAWVQVQKLN
jgi:hypothetical protein